MVVRNLMGLLIDAERCSKGGWQVLPGLDVRVSDVSAPVPDVLIRSKKFVEGGVCDDMTDEALVAFLRGRPDFRNRVASIALAMENADGALDEADAAEERLVEEMRRLGREAVQGWPEKRVEATEQEIRQQPSTHRQGKKNSAGIRNSATLR